MLGVLGATALRGGEGVTALALEGAAWATHLLSQLESRLVAPPRSLEQRLAARLRPDA